jgi:hypothetical protein
MSDSNKNLVMGPRWGRDTKTDWPTDRWSQNNLNLNENVHVRNTGTSPAQKIEDA